MNENNKTVNSSSEKRKRRAKFDILDAVHASEYSSLKRPIDPSTKKPIEPAHKFEVTLESDAFSVAKYVKIRFSRSKIADHLQMGRLSTIPDEDTPGP